MKSHLILFVDDQRRSAEFYARALDLRPRLDVPGMTEFALSSGAVLGLMPVAGIRRLLGAAVPDPAEAKGIPRCELYLRVADPERRHAAALSAGARELSPLLPRDWGDAVAYSADPDGHVIAFASDATEVEPSASDRALWQRRLAAHANNRAWDLAESRSRSADEDEEMLHAAHAAMHLWSIVGDTRQRAHAALLLAHAFALLGDGSHAARYLARAEPLLLASDAAGWERALTEAVGAGVAAAQGDAAVHRSRHHEAVRLAAALEDPDDRGVVEATLRTIPVPRA